MMKQFGVLLRTPINWLGEHQVAKKSKIKRKEYTDEEVKLIKSHSKARTPVAKLSKLMKRSEGSLRQKALALGVGLGHQR
ncbi:5-bromo-4-chloroindolyl phosphate hydrolysis protein [Bradyrhizobium sp. LM3.2]